MSENNPLNDYQLGWLNQGRSLELGEPPHPWKLQVVIEAAGIFACGWSKTENLLLISNDGYTLTDITSDQRLITNFDPELMYSLLLDNQLRFRIQETNEIVDIFGLRAGDGIHKTSDSWILKIIYPWWPLLKVTLHNGEAGGSYRIWQNVYGIRMAWLGDGWMKCGFSPSGMHFVVIGHAGAEIFSRSELT